MLSHHASATTFRCSPTKTLVFLAGPSYTFKKCSVKSSCLRCCCSTTRNYRHADGQELVNMDPDRHKCVTHREEETRQSRSHSLIFNQAKRAHSHLHMSNSHKRRQPPTLSNDFSRRQTGGSAVRCARHSWVRESDRARGQKAKKRGPHRSGPLPRRGPGGVRGRRAEGENERGGGACRRAMGVFGWGHYLLTPVFQVALRGQ